MEPFLFLMVLTLLINRSAAIADPPAAADTNVVDHARIVFPGIEGFESSGWPLGVVNYTDWAAHETFTVHDRIVFVPKNGGHQVLEVDQAAYERCATDQPIKNWTNPNWTEATSFVNLA